MPVHAMITVLDVQAQSDTINDDERVIIRSALPSLPSTSHVCVTSRSFNPRASRQRSEVLYINSSQRSLFSLLSSQYSLFSPLPIQYHPYRPSSLFSLSCTASLTFWLEQQNGTLLITFPAAHGGTVLRYRTRRQARACTHLCKPHEYSLHTCVNLIKCSNSLYTHDPEHIQSIRIEGGTRGGR